MARKLGAFFALLMFIMLLASAAAQEGKSGKVDVDAVFKKLDANADGKLTKIEFLKLAERYKKMEKAREKLAVAYDKLDPKNIGLSRTQFRAYVEAANAKKKK